LVGPQCRWTSEVGWGGGVSDPQPRRCRFRSASGHATDRSSSSAAVRLTGDARDPSELGARFTAM